MGAWTAITAQATEPSASLILSDGRIWTGDPANPWAAGEEDSKGSLSVGKLAALVVLDGNPLEVPPNQLKDLQVQLTILGGEIAYKAP